MIAHDQQTADAGAATAVVAEDVDVLERAQEVGRYR